eukprot:421617-Prorocentrum_minimum.AAC.1
MASYGGSRQHEWRASWGGVDMKWRHMGGHVNMCARRVSADGRGGACGATGVSSETISPP